LIFFIIGYSWYYGEQKLKNNLHLKYKRTKLNELSLRFGLTQQRQKSIFFVNNQSFDIQSKFSSRFILTKCQICFKIFLIHLKMMKMSRIIQFQIVLI
jgi:hypothetical protein